MQTIPAGCICSYTWAPPPPLGIGGIVRNGALASCPADHGDSAANSDKG